MDPKLAREQTIRDAKCNLILDAAREVFAEVGFHTARLEDIATRAGFSKASLYNYYESKEVIFLNLAIREYESLDQKIAATLNPTAPLEESLRNVTKCILDVFGKHFAIMMEITEFRRLGLPGFAEIMKSHNDLFNVFRTFATGLQERLAGIFEAARSRGEIVTPISDRVLAGYFGAMIRGMLFEWKIAGKMGQVATETEMMLSFMMHGVKGNQP